MDKFPVANSSAKFQKEETNVLYRNRHFKIQAWLRHHRRSRWHGYSFLVICQQLWRFSLLKQLLDALDGQKKIGFESTGHYGHNLKLFLEANNFSFMEFNPLLVSKFVRSKSLRNTKTDSLDAVSIAQYLMTVEYKPYPPSFYHMDQLKSLTRFRDSLVRQHSRQLVELTNILDKVFPEFKPFFDGKFSATALYILTHYQSPEKIANMNAKSYEALRKKSRGKFSMVKFAQLKTLAKTLSADLMPSFSSRWKLP